MAVDLEAILYRCRQKGTDYASWKATDDILVMACEIDSLRSDLSAARAEIAESIQAAIRRQGAGGK